MKTDKKELMKKLVSVGVMSSMLAAGAMTCETGSFFPSAAVSAFSAEAETALANIKATYDFNELANSFNAETAGRDYILIYITENGTYKLTGANYNEDGDCYIDVQIVVDEGVTANLILDGLNLKNNNLEILSSGGGEPYYDNIGKAHFVIDGTANIYIKSNSSLGGTVNDSGAVITGYGTVNFMESENKAILTTDRIDNDGGRKGAIDTANISCHGGFVYCGVSDLSNLELTDGFIGDFTNDDCGISYAGYFTDLKITGGYFGSCSEYPQSDGGTPIYFTQIKDLPANTQLYSYNGKDYKYSCTDPNGVFATYLPDLTASGLVVSSGDGVVYLFESDDVVWYNEDTCSARGWERAYRLTNPEKLFDKGTLKYTKVYDGNGNFTANALSGSFSNTIGDSLTNISLVSVPTSIDETDVGNYTATTNVAFSYNGKDYQVSFGIPAEITAAPLTISSAVVKDKEYDGTNAAEVTEITFSGIKGSDELVLGKDYTVTAEFEDSSAGTDKTVNVTVELADSIKNYTLANSKITAQADIIASATEEDDTATATATNSPYIPAPPSTISPATTTTTTTTTTAPEEDADDKDGETNWNTVITDILDARDGDTVTVEMTGTTELPKSILSELKGKDVDLVLDMGNGFVWTINGKDIDDPSTIDMAVGFGSGISAKVINEVTGECDYITISLAHNGDFGFKAVLTVDLGAENDGLYANLYYYLENEDDAEFMCCGKINKHGMADLDFTHASEYIIVIDVEAHSENSITDDSTNDDDSDVSGDNSADNDSADDDSNPPTGVALGFAGLITAGAAVVFARKRK